MSLALQSRDDLDAARDVLRRTFGHSEFRGLQAPVIGEVMAGRSAMAVLPTGGGKSLCYQIPAMIRPGVGLVVSPLIALMSDQVAALRQAGVAAARLGAARSRGELGNGRTQALQPLGGACVGASQDDFGDRAGDGFPHGDVDFGPDDVVAQE